MTPLDLEQFLASLSLLAFASHLFFFVFSFSFLLPLVVVVEGTGEHISDRNVSTCTPLPHVPGILFWANVTIFKQLVPEYHIIVLLMSAASCSTLGVYDRIKKDGTVCRFIKPCILMDSHSVNNVCHFKCNCLDDYCSLEVMSIHNVSLISVCEIYIGQIPGS